MMVLATILNVVALTWVMDLEKNGCPCAAGWRRSVIKYWYILALLWPLVVLTIRPPMGITKALGAFGVVAFVALASSLWDIQRQKCRCAQDWREKVLLVTTVLSVVGIFLRIH